jgi:hypothetical protein
LRKRAVRRLVAPDALRRRQQWVAAVAVFVVAVVLIAVHDHFIADVPALDLGADGPDHARSIGSGDMKGVLVTVQRRYRNAEAGPDAVIVDPAGHDIDQHLVLGDRPGWNDLLLHRLFGRPMALLADRPGMHVRRNVPERRHFADVVKVFQRGR